MGASYLPFLKEAAQSLNIDLTAYSGKQLNLCPEIMTDALRDMKTADMILLYRSAEGFWDEIDDELKVLQKESPLLSSAVIRPCGRRLPSIRKLSPPYTIIYCSTEGKISERC